MPLFPLPMLKPVSPVVPLPMVLGPAMPVFKAVLALRRPVMVFFTSAAEPVVFSEPVAVIP